MLHQNLDCPILQWPFQFCNVNPVNRPARQLFERRYLEAYSFKGLPNLVLDAGIGWGFASIERMSWFDEMTTWARYGGDTKRECNSPKYPSILSRSTLCDRRSALPRFQLTSSDCDVFVSGQEGLTSIYASGNMQRLTDWTCDSCALG